MTGPAGAETATIQVTIDGREVTVPAGTTILDAARDLGIDIPTLCHHETLSPAASCRLCVVEVEGRPNLMPACATELTDGMSLADGVRGRRRGAQAHPRPAPLRPPAGLHHLRAVGRLHAAGVLLPLRRRGEHVRGRQAQAPHRERQPDDRARHEQVHPLRQVRARLRRGAGHQRHRLHRARLRVADRRLLRQPAGDGLLPLLRPVRRHLPHRRHRQQAAQGHAHLGPREGAHHLPLLRRRLQLRPQRRRRQGPRRHRRLRRAGQPGLALRQGPLPHRPHLQPGPHHHAADQEGRRLGERDLGRGPRAGREAAARDPRRTRQPVRGRPQLGALHQRGELPPAAPHAGGPQHQLA